jgi:hypothetical protein
MGRLVMGKLVRGWLVRGWLAIPGTAGPMTTPGKVVPTTPGTVGLTADVAGRASMSSVRGGANVSSEGIVPIGGAPGWGCGVGLSISCPHVTAATDIQIVRDVTANRDRSALR